MRLIKPKFDRIPKLTLYLTASKNNQIYINPDAAKILKIKEGDRVLFGHDEKDETIFYILKAKTRCGFRVSLHSNSKSLVCCSVEFCQLLKQTFNPQKSKLELYISLKPITIDGIEAFVLLNHIDE